MTINAFDRPAASAAGDSAFEGNSGAASRADHRHAREAADANLSGTPSTSAVGDSAAVGSSTTGSRSDHRHGREAFATTAEIADVAATESAGSSATVARGDHVHADAAYGAWASWTPTITQSGAVTATIARAKYKKIDKTVHLMFDLNVTSSGTAGNEVVIGGLPFPAAYSSFQHIGACGIFDASASDDFTGVLRFAGTDFTLTMLSTRADGPLGVVSFTAALASGDVIHGAGTFETP